MGVFAERMGSHEETVSSPDGNISARLGGGGLKSIAFKPGTYNKYTDSALQNQLHALSRLVYVAHVRARDAALFEALGGDDRPEPRRLESTRERETLRRQRELSVTVDTGHLEVTAVGGTEWHVRIKPGTVRQVPEEEFLREAGLAAKQILAQWRLRMHQIRFETFGPSDIYRGMVRP